MNFTSVLVAVSVMMEETLRFVERMTHGTLEPLLRPVERMVDERRTVSDRILEWFGKEEITGAEAREGALHFAEAFEEDLLDVKEKLYGLAAA